MHVQQEWILHVGFMPKTTHNVCILCGHKRRRLSQARYNKSTEQCRYVRRNMYTCLVACEREWAPFVRFTWGIAEWRVTGRQLRHTNPIRYAWHISRWQQVLRLGVCKNLKTSSEWLPNLPNRPKSAPLIGTSGTSDPTHSKAYYLGYILKKISTLNSPYQPRLTPVTERLLGQNQICTENQVHFPVPPVQLRSRSNLVSKERKEVPFEPR